MNNKRDYNLISVPQITRVLLGEAIISSKTPHVVVVTRRREAMVKLEIVKKCQQFCHLFEFFILNNKAIFCRAFAV